jgi:hypothetical protein
MVTGKAPGVAQVLLISLTEVALAAGREEPRDAEAIAYPETRHPFPNLVHDPDDLVAWDERKLRKREVAFDDVQVGAADSAGLDAQANFTGARDRRGQIQQLERILLDRLRLRETHRLHGSPAARLVP